MRLHVMLLLALSALAVASGASVLPGGKKAWIKATENTGPTYSLLNPTSCGYLPLTAGREGSNGSRSTAEMYYIYFEAEEPELDLATTPIILWLQGGPGCSSLFGMLYINGPYFVQPDLTLRRNPGAWNKRYGMLFIDQPVGVGFSKTGSYRIPDRELPLADDLYRALNNFYRAHPQHQQRPLFITGESYAGKYVPSIAHYILQAGAIHGGWEHEMAKRRNVSSDVEAPLFKLGGAAIGNGFTDAIEQTRVQAEIAWSMGLIDTRQRQQAEAMQDRIIELCSNDNWRHARVLSDQLLAFITNCSASATLEDIRRDKAYDAEDLTTQYLDRADVKANMNAAHDVTYESCSKEVDHVMGHDVMKSTSGLVADIIKYSHLLIYLGQFDAECGVASNEAWLSKLRWPGHIRFNNAERRIRRDAHGHPLGYHKQYKTLTQVVIRNVGHMAPHDSPLVLQDMLYSWMDSAQRTPPSWQGWEQEGDGTGADAAAGDL